MTDLALINRDLSREVERLAAEAKKLLAENARLLAQLRQESDGRYFVKGAIDLDLTPGTIDPPESLSRPQRYEPQTVTIIAGSTAVEQNPLRVTDDEQESPAPPTPDLSPVEARANRRATKARNLRALVLAILAHGSVGSSDLRLRLGLSQIDFHRLTMALRSQGLIVKTGVKRWTVWSLACTPAQAGKETT
jgi:hypothetical protein